MGKEQKLEQLEKVLHSRTLQNSESLKAFLRFVVEKTVANQEVQLKEYVIATEVFGRNSDYDSRIDSVVRVQAGRLRTKLQEYYATEGKGDQIVIDLPKGHYHPVFTYSPPEPPTESPPTQPVLAFAAPTNGHATPLSTDIHSSVGLSPTARSRKPWPVILTGAVIVMLGLAVLALAFSNRELRRRTTSGGAPSLTVAEYKSVWGAFLNDPEPPLLVLSNPAVYRFINKSDPAPLT
ncbi:MAG: hypothetical protein ACRD9R_02560, partial [Pyrinomonadaceae bacterium]